MCGGCGWGCLVPSMCFATMFVPVCVVLCVSWSCCCQILLEWLHDVAWAVCWGGSRSTKPCVFPCKVAAAGDESYLVCRGGCGWGRLVPSMCFATMVVPACVVLFLFFWICACQIALEWLHECCLVLRLLAYYYCLLQLKTLCKSVLEWLHPGWW